MGFLQSLFGKFISSLGPTSKMAKEWEENITMEQIEDLERQGCDMTEYRKRYEERKSAQAAKEEELTRRSLEALDIEKLKSYMAFPRDVESEFVKDALAANKLSAKHAQKVAQAPIIYAAVVQAHYALYEPGEEGNYGVVFTFALDDKHIYDEEWLTNLADKISELKEGTSLPLDNAKFIKTLRDDQSIFCFKLGESLCGDADAWAVTFAVYGRKNLPLGYLPATRIMPMLLLETPKVNNVLDLGYVPLKYYTK